MSIESKNLLLPALIGAMSLAMAGCGGGSSSSSGSDDTPAPGVSDEPPLTYDGETGPASITEENKAAIAQSVVPTIPAYFASVFGDTVIVEMPDYAYSEAEYITYEPAAIELENERQWVDIDETVSGNCTGASGSLGSAHVVSEESGSDREYIDTEDAEYESYQWSGSYSGTTTYEDFTYCGEDFTVTVTGTDTFSGEDSGTETSRGGETLENTYTAEYSNAFNYSEVSISEFGYTGSARGTVYMMESDDAYTEETSVVISIGGTDVEFYYSEENDTETSLVAVGGVTYGFDTLGFEGYELTLPEFGQVSVMIESEIDPCDGFAGFTGEMIIWDGTNAFAVEYETCGGDYTLSEVAEWNGGGRAE